MKNIKFKKLRALMVILLAVGLAVSVYARNKFAGEFLPCENPVSDTRYTDNSPDKNREENRAGNISAVWINYYEFGELIKNKNKEEYTAAVEETVANVKNAGLNAIFLHVRSHADAFYRSEIFPWSYYIYGHQGQGPDFDPLEIFINIAHSSEVQIHAWVNPYRVLSGSTSADMLSENNPVYGILKNDDTQDDSRVFVSGGGLYLNPADEQNRRLVTDGIKEIIDKYDVDGIHFDDYFYPTTDSAVDAAEYSLYCEGADNPLDLASWRRAQVDLLVSAVNKAVKSSARPIIFGISPQANIDKDRDELFADVEKWAKGGYVDYICPQIYFGFDYPKDEFKFTSLLQRWESIVSDDVSFYIGLGPYKLGLTDAGSDEWVNSRDLIKRQAEYVDENTKAGGIVLYNYSAFFSLSEQNTAEREALSGFLNSGAFSD